MKYQVKHLKEVLEGIPDDNELFIDGFPLYSVDAAWMDSVAYLHIKREMGCSCDQGQGPSSRGCY